MIDNLKNSWINFSAKKKRLFLWAALLIILIPLLLLLMPESTSPRSKSNSNDRVIQNVLTDSDTTGVSQNAIAARLRSLSESLNKTNQSVEELAKSLKVDDINKRLLAIEARQKNETSQREALEKRIKDGYAPLPYATGARSRDIYGADGKTMEKGGDKSGAKIKESDATLQRVYESASPEPQRLSEYQTETNKTGSGQNKKDVPVLIPEIEIIQQEIDDEPSEKDDDSGFQTYLPATAIMSGVFVSGMDAPTSQNARQDPYPALIRIKKDAILPNRFRADIRECGMLAAGFGELSSERAYFRSEVITCIRDDGAVFESPIDSFAVGEDGKAGVRGRLVTKQGQYLAKALTAGFLQAASQLFSVQNIPTINVNREGSTNNTTPYQQVMSSTALQGAAIAGVGGSLERLADFYMKMANDLFPVIEIDPGRSVDFIVKKGVTLKFSRVNVGSQK